ncbi:hypothetical protein A2U01_0097328, partial [Trifolium medium]|nr:hypothetical protein [Trifolium medium]
LIAQSGRFTSQNSDDLSGAGKLYSEFINNRIAVSDCEHQPPSVTVDPPPVEAVEAEVKCQDKEVISEIVSIPTIPTV